jgi:methyl acetate hydrolase
MLDDTDYLYALSDANLPGAAAMIVDRNGARYAKAVGYADWPGEQPLALDTVCQIASMTKAVTSVAAMQLVEQGRLQLDAPIGRLLPELAAPQVITGFAEDGTVQTRAARGPVTLRHLLTHTSGLGYPFVQTEVLRYHQSVGMPKAATREWLRMPLLFDPGERWEYGVSTDYVGFAIEAVTGQDLRTYLNEQVFQPLAMKDTDFRRELAGDAARVHVRSPDGSFATNPIVMGVGEFYSGGGGLSSTAPDYARFLRMILRGGELDGVRVLSAETVAEMGTNQVGTLRAGAMGSSMPELAQPFDILPDQHTGWGLGFLINPEPGPAGRSPGSLAWAGIFNSYYWIDPLAGIAGVFITQLSPFGDPGALSAFAALERMAYK